MVLADIAPGWAAVIAATVAACAGILAAWVAKGARDAVRNGEARVDRLEQTVARHIEQHQLGDLADDKRLVERIDQLLDRLDRQQGGH